MHPMLSAELARLHQADLLREAEAYRRVRRVRDSGPRQSRPLVARFTHLWASKQQPVTTPSSSVELA